MHLIKNQRSLMKSLILFTVFLLSNPLYAQSNGVILSAGQMKVVGGIPVACMPSGGLNAVSVKSYDCNCYAGNSRAAGFIAGSTQFDASTSNTPAQIQKLADASCADTTSASIGEVVFAANCKAM
jgi:hypothetical protein